MSTVRYGNSAEVLSMSAEVQEEPPTSDQLNSILEYVGSDKAGQIVKGATSTTDALRKLKQSGDSFIRPCVVDWNNGRAGQDLWLPLRNAQC